MIKSNLWDVITQIFYRLVIGSNLQMILHLQQCLEKTDKLYLMSAVSGANRQILKFA